MKTSHYTVANTMLCIYSAPYVLWMHSYGPKWYWCAVCTHLDNQDTHDWSEGMWITLVSLAYFQVFWLTGFIVLTYFACWFKQRKNLMGIWLNIYYWKPYISIISYLYHVRFPVSIKGAGKIIASIIQTSLNQCMSVYRTCRYFV